MRMYQKMILGILLFQKVVGLLPPKNVRPMNSVFLASNATAEQMLTNCTRTLSVRIQFVRKCSAYAYNL